MKNLSLFCLCFLFSCSEGLFGPSRWATSDNQPGGNRASSLNGSEDSSFLGGGGVVGSPGGRVNSGESGSSNGGTQTSSDDSQTTSDDDSQTTSDDGSSTEDDGSGEINSGEGTSEPGGDTGTEGSPGGESGEGEDTGGSEGEYKDCSSLQIYQKSEKFKKEVEDLEKIIFESLEKMKSANTAGDIYKSDVGDHVAVDGDPPVYNVACDDINFDKIPGFLDDENAECKVTADISNEELFCKEKSINGNSQKSYFTLDFDTDEKKKSFAEKLTKEMCREVYDQCEGGANLAYQIDAEPTEPSYGESDDKFNVEAFAYKACKDISFTHCIQDLENADALTNEDFRKAKDHWESELCQKGDPLCDGGPDDDAPPEGAPELPGE